MPAAEPVGRGRWLAACPSGGFTPTEPTLQVTALSLRANAARRIASHCAAALLLAAAGCKGENGAGLFAGTARTAGGAVEPEAAGPVIIAVPTARYVAGAVASAAVVSGIVTTKSALAAAEPTAVGRDSALCGRVLPDSSVQQRGAGLGNVIVWIDGVRRGKALPVEKRLELESDHCILTPRVQGAVVGSAVNVLGHDDFRQHLRFIAAGDSAARAAILLGRDEQVIPTDLLARAPGLVIVRDTDHPWPRAYLAVFDHPYFAVTKPDGSFTIDGVPPGTYTLVTWHERTGRMEQPLAVAGSAVKVSVVVEGK